jgi:hypothetical protein
VYFTQRLYEYLQIKPYAAHATFQFSGTPGKRHRFREAQLWDEKYEYFQKLGEWACCKNVWGTSGGIQKMGEWVAVGNIECLGYIFFRLQKLVEGGTVGNRSFGLAAISMAHNNHLCDT